MICHEEIRNSIESNLIARRAVYLDMGRLTTGERSISLCRVGFKPRRYGALWCMMIRLCFGSGLRHRAGRMQRKRAAGFLAKPRNYVTHSLRNAAPPISSGQLGSEEEYELLNVESIFPGFKWRLQILTTQVVGRFRS